MQLVTCCLVKLIQLCYFQVTDSPAPSAPHVLHSVRPQVR